jgi:hypothetical protein
MISLGWFAVAFITLGNMLAWSWIASRLISLGRAHRQTHETLALVIQRLPRAQCLSTTRGIQIGDFRPVLTCTRSLGHRGLHENENGTQWKTQSTPDRQRPR